ncbi:MAG: DUF697 domain-containing protein [Kiritimatiellae bacterium]|nr:DUF697 domain-containing protein [Kiritimatiellia bacterium]
MKELSGDNVAKNTMFWTTGAGLVPIPVFDLVAVTGLQLNMLRRICKIYEVKFSKNIGKNLIGALIGGPTPSTPSMPAASLIKLMPFVGQTVGVVTMPIFSGGVDLWGRESIHQTFRIGRNLVEL